MNKRKRVADIKHRVKAKKAKEKRAVKRAAGAKETK
jgi:hypothetical protein